ncbi:MAG: selenocysteine-specific translation elongation factor [Acidobacteriota bacterium]
MRFRHADAVAPPPPMSSAAQAEPAPPRRRRVVVGTAGHIDHGKTQLIRALTGTDCDRWAEEKERGITIDIGFAHLVEGDLQVGFVDVPGHERFLHNALAGLGGIRIAMLVVAASEGVMPQTREHLAICSLLEIPSAIVALTKVDLVTDDLAELAELEVGELLESTPFAGAPIVRVSSQTGEGVEALRAALVNMADGHEIAVEPGSLARLPIDRAFHLPGLGVLVTGTLISGTIEPRQDLELLPAGRSARVRGVQVHGEARDRASAGERTSLQLGGVELVELHRGMQIVTPGAFSPSGHFGASFTLLGDAPEPLTESVEIRIHLYSGEVLGAASPPGSAGPGARRHGAGGAAALRAHGGRAWGPLHRPPTQSRPHPRRGADPRPAVAPAPGGCPLHRPPIPGVGSPRGPGALGCLRAGEGNRRGRPGPSGGKRRGDGGAGPRNHD